MRVLVDAPSHGAVRVVAGSMAPENGVGAGVRRRVDGAAPGVTPRLPPAVAVMVAVMVSPS